MHGLGIADVAHGVDGDGTRRGELVPKRRNRFGVDVGEHHRHAEPGGMAGQTRTDTRPGASDYGHAATERVASGHGTEDALLYSAKGTESSASKTTVIEVSTMPFSTRRIPTSTTPLDTSKGMLLVIWLTYR